MPQATYLTLEEAARKYDVAEKVLTQLIAAGMIETHETPTGDVLVVADKNGNSQELQTKEEIITANFAHLREQPISAHAALSATTFKDVDGVTVSVDVTNTGQMAGQEDLM